MWLRRTIEDAGLADDLNILWRGVAGWRGAKNGNGKIAFPIGNGDGQLAGGERGRGVGARADLGGNGHRQHAARRAAEVVRHDCGVAAARGAAFGTSAASREEHNPSNTESKTEIGSRHSDSLPLSSPRTFPGIERRWILAAKATLATQHSETVQEVGTAKVLREGSSEQAANIPSAAKSRVDIFCFMALLKHSSSETRVFR